MLKVNDLWILVQVESVILLRVHHIDEGMLIEVDADRRNLYFASKGTHDHVIRITCKTNTFMGFTTRYWSGPSLCPVDPQPRSWEITSAY